MPPTILYVATQFSRTPGSRYVNEGNYSGEAFRRGLLLPAIRTALSTGVGLVVDLDGTAGFGTSFLEEAFGGLVREDGIRADDVKRILEIKSEEEPYLREDVFTYIDEAGAAGSER